MDPLIISLIGFGAILSLAFLRFPLALSMGLVGVIGFGELSGYRAAISNLGIRMCKSSLRSRRLRSCRV